MVFPNSTWAIPVGSFPFPVPPPSPEGGPACDQVVVTFDKEWLPYVLGALDQLVLQTTWDVPLDQVHIMQEKANNLIRQFMQAQCPPVESQPQCCGEDDMACCFRVQDNKLQQFCCGEWTTILDLNGIGGGQPGPQPTHPTPGGPPVFTCYTLQGPGTGFLPWAVSTGDVISLSNPSGAVNDQVETPWRGPSGRSFVANAYVPFSETTNSTDRLPTAHHETVIATFDGGTTWYDIYQEDSSGNPTPFTVPAGVSNVQPVIAINIPIGSSVAGDYGICVSVQNNSPAPWSHTLNFLVSPYGWVPDTREGRQGKWVSGQGWVPDVDSTAIEAKFTGSAFTITRAVLYGTDGGPISGASAVELFFPVPTQLGAARQAPIAGSSWSIDSGAVSVTNTVLAFGLEDGTGSGLAVTEIHIEGIGFDPFSGFPSP